MNNIIAVFVGGGIGAVLRYITGIFCLSHLKLNFPIATFLVNILGCIILGALFIFFNEKTNISPAIKYTLTVGFCGGLTTFSTFSLEIYKMLQDANYQLAIIYIVISIIVGLLGVFIGGYICKTFII